jgi:hypothetical protein
MHCFNFAYGPEMVFFDRAAAMALQKLKLEFAPEVAPEQPTNVSLFKWMGDGRLGPVLTDEDLGALQTSPSQPLVVLAYVPQALAELEQLTSAYGEAQKAIAPFANGNDTLNSEQRSKVRELLRMAGLRRARLDQSAAANAMRNTIVTTLQGQFQLKINSLRLQHELNLSNLAQLQKVIFEGQLDFKDVRSDNGMAANDGRVPDVSASTPSDEAHKLKEFCNKTGVDVQKATSVALLQRTMVFDNLADTAGMARKQAALIENLNSVDGSSVICALTELDSACRTIYAPLLMSLKNALPALARAEEVAKMLARLGREAGITADVIARKLLDALQPELNEEQRAEQQAQQARTVEHELLVAIETLQATPDDDIRQVGPSEPQPKSPQPKPQPETPKQSQPGKQPEQQPDEQLERPKTPQDECLLLRVKIEQLQLELEEAGAEKHKLKQRLALRTGAEAESRLQGELQTSEAKVASLNKQIAVLEATNAQLVQHTEDRLLAAKVEQAAALANKASELQHAEQCVAAEKQRATALEEQAAAERRVAAQQHAAALEQARVQAHKSNTVAVELDAARSELNTTAAGMALELAALREEVLQSRRDLAAGRTEAAEQVRKAMDNATHERQCKTQLERELASAQEAIARSHGMRDALRSEIAQLEAELRDA